MKMRKENALPIIPDYTRTSGPATHHEYYYDQAIYASLTAHPANLWQTAIKRTGSIDIVKYGTLISQLDQDTARNERLRIPSPPR